MTGCLYEPCNPAQTHRVNTWCSPPIEHHRWHRCFVTHRVDVARIQCDTSFVGPNPVRMLEGVGRSMGSTWACGGGPVHVDRSTALLAKMPAGSPYMYTHCVVERPNTWFNSPHLEPNLQPQPQPNPTQPNPLAGDPKGHPPEYLWPHSRLNF